MRARPALSLFAATATAFATIAFAAIAFATAFAAAFAAIAVATAFAGVCCHPALPGTTLSRL